VKFTENLKYWCPIPNVTVKNLDRLDIPKKPSEVRAEDFYPRENMAPSLQGAQMGGRNNRSISGSMEAMKDGTRTVWLQELRTTLYTN